MLGEKLDKCIIIGCNRRECHTLIWKARCTLAEMKSSMW